MKYQEIINDMKALLEEAYGTASGENEHLADKIDTYLQNLPAYLKDCEDETVITSEKFVKSIYPDACVIKIHKVSNDKYYYNCETSSNCDDEFTLSFGCETELEAWNEAEIHIISPHV